MAPFRGPPPAPMAMGTVAVGGGVAFVSAAAPSAAHHAPLPPRAAAAGAAAGEGRAAVGGQTLTNALGAGTAAVAAATAAAAAAGRRGRHDRWRLRPLRAEATASTSPGGQQGGKPAMSQALPWMMVPGHLTGDPLNKDFPGDLGFDPLGFASEDFTNQVFQNFGVEFNARRWYREAELMHGRVAMLATFNVVLRETPFTGFMPETQMERNALVNLVQFMTILEGVRGWRLLVDQERIAGDLGFGMGPFRADRGQLAEKTYKELQNGRLAMLAFAGIAAQWSVTGRAVGIDVTSIVDFFYSEPVNDQLIRSVVLSVAGLVMLGDGVRRLSSSDKGSSASSSIAAKAINPLKITAGVQEPGVALPAGVVAGQLPQTLDVSEQQVVQFEEDGVIMVKGAFKEWVPYLQAITKHQIENPHVWSLIGRMSGLYDYIQRNMWMTNDGFRDFLYYSPLGHVLSQLGRTKEVRCTTDMLLVNPNKGFGWHQDNQNGPIDFPYALRWWVAMDRCGQNDFGAPEYLLGSHRNGSVDDKAVFVSLEDGDLSSFTRKTKFLPEPGDLIIWDARTIHRIVSPPGQCWQEGTQRRALGGTVAKDGAVYLNKGGASGISDLAGHAQKNGEKLGSPYFPRIYPTRDSEEEEIRSKREIIGRSPKKIAELVVTLVSNAGKYVSFTKVVGKKN